MPEAAVAVDSRGRSRQLAEELRQQIIRRRIEPGSRLPTQRQLAKHYNLTVVTVTSIMARLEKEGLVVRKQGSGSYVAEQTSTLDYIQSDYAGENINRDRCRVWMNDFSRLCYERGWAVRWHFVSEAEAADIDRLTNRFATSHSVLVSMDNARHVVRSLHQRGVRAAAVYTFAQGGADTECPQITIDRRQMGRKASEYLVSLGYRRIAYFGPAERISAQIRMRGLLDVVQQHELPVPAEWLIETSAEDVAELRRQLHRLLSATPRPEALCVADQRQAGDLQDAILAAGLRIPEDIAMVACDGSPPNRPLPVELTVVSESPDDARDEAVKLLAAMQRTTDGIDCSNCGPMPIMLPLRVHVGESCGAKQRQ